MEDSSEKILSKLFYRKWEKYEKIKDWNKSILENKNSIFSGKKGKLASNATDVSNILNDFFINVGNDITKSIYHNPTSPTEYLTNRNSDSIVISTVTPF